MTLKKLFQYFLTKVSSCYELGDCGLPAQYLRSLTCSYDDKQPAQCIRSLSYDDIQPPLLITTIDKVFELPYCDMGCHGETSHLNVT